MESRISTITEQAQAAADRITSVKLQMHTLQGEFWEFKQQDDHNKMEIWQAINALQNSQNEINVQVDKKILELQKAVDEFESTQRQVAQNCNSLQRHAIELQEMKDKKPEKIDSKLNCLRDWVNHLRFSNKTIESKLDILRSKMVVQQKFDYYDYDDYPDGDAGLEPAARYSFLRFQ